MAFFEETGPEGTRRGETFTCCHCNRIGEFRDNMGMFKPPDMCSQEHKPLCPACAREANSRVGACAVFEKKLEAMESRDRMLRAIGLV